MKQQQLLLCTLLLLFILPKAQSQSIMHDGLERFYSVYIPSVYDANQATPLVFNLHGYGSANWQQEVYGDFRPIADTANFIIVHPNGTADPTGSNYWNVGFAPSAIDDIGFLEALIDSLSATYNIDPNRIYSTGMSNGGYMSYEFACQSKKIAAIASVTGSMTTSTRNNCNPERAVPAMQIHGTSDPTVAYEGDTAINSLHIDTIVQYWVNNNNCSPTPNIDTVPNTNTTDGADALLYTYVNGDDGSTVEFYKVFGGAHTWPGAPLVIGTTCMDFNASEVIWQFFNQYTLDQFYTSPNTNTEVLSTTNNEIQVFPNPAHHTLTLSSETLIEQVRILDLNGRILIHQQNLMENYVQVSISDLPKGVYFAQVFDGKSWTPKQFVKQ